MNTEGLLQLAPETYKYVQLNTKIKWKLFL